MDIKILFVPGWLVREIPSERPVILHSAATRLKGAKCTVKNKYGIHKGKIKY